MQRNGGQMQRNRLDSNDSCRVGVMAVPLVEQGKLHRSARCCVK